MKNCWIYFILLFILLQQCAKPTAPIGGPKDETPPKLKSSSPKHEQTNVKTSKIELQFDELIQLNNPREQIIITPSVGKNFETIFSKNKVTLDLKSELHENTTYSINFREAIQDLNEKNPAMVKIAFSTGSYIDSLTINGTISDALTEKKLLNYTVALAEASDTFNIFKHPASWLTLTNKKGFFSIENLKPGTYILYAFDDKSKNLIVDSKSEKYGFLSQQINLTTNLDSLKIRTFKLDINKLKLITARTTFAYFNLRFSKSLIDYNVTAIDSTVNIYASLEPDLTTVKLYNTIPNLDSLQIRVQATDSLNLMVDTLVYMKFPKKDATRDRFTSTIENTTVNESNGQLSTQLNFTKPVTHFNPDSMFIEIDSLTHLPFTAADYQWENKQSRLILKRKFDLVDLFPIDTSSINDSKTNDLKLKSSPTVKKTPTLIFKKGTFISVENDTAQSIAAPLNLIKTESTAIIEVAVQTKEDFILQLLNKSEEIVQQRPNEKNTVLDNLPPATYLLRIIVDLNKNGKWDAGDFAIKTDPEPIVYYRNPKGLKEISLKANWTLGPLLITY